MKKLTLFLICLLLVLPCQAGTFPGDINGDYKVDFNDFAMFASHWLKSVDCEPSVTQEWIARYSGPNNLTDMAIALAVDTFGDLYVTGVTDYNFSEYNSGDYATIKYGADINEPLWIARYNGPGNGYNTASAIAIDSDNNVYVTGESGIWGAYADYATIKYSPDGNELWVARYNGSNNSRNGAYAIAIDSSDNVFVTGASWRYRNDYVTIKYTPDGNEVWVARYNGPGNGHDSATAIGIDSSGNVYVTGTSSGYGTYPYYYDYATIKYSPDGNELWVARYNGLGNSIDNAYAIVIDSNDNVYVAGRSEGSDTMDDYATIKYSPDGNELWVARYNGPGNGNDSARAVAIDSNDNVYVTGKSVSTGTGYDYATIKYAPDSNQPLWVARYNGLGNYPDYVSAIAIDCLDNIYVTGESFGSNTNHDYATIKYDPNGDELWVARYNGPANNQDWARAIGIDKSNNIYVTGFSSGSATLSDYATIKYSPACICTTQIPGDLSNDCKVDLHDLSILITRWLERVDNLVFIHHSCGQNWLYNSQKSLHSALLCKDYIGERNDIYYGTDLTPNSGRPDSLGPTPGDKTDMNHWILWFNDYLSGVKTHGCSDGVNKIIMFKSCFPNSNITSDGTEPGNPFSSQKTMTNYKAVYRHHAGPNNVYSYAGYTYKPMEDIFAENPDTLFIPITAPPRHYAPSDATNDADAHRARVFNNWLKNEWLASYNAAYPGLNNVAVFDWFDILVYADDHTSHPNRLKGENGGEAGDSHPNDLANSYSTYIFAAGPNNFIDNAWNAFVPNP